MEYNSLQVKRG